LTISDTNQRDSVIRNIILRYVGQTYKTADSNIFNDEEAMEAAEDPARLLFSGHANIQFLIYSLHIPSVWIHESIAYYAGSSFQSRSHIEHLNFAGMVIEANEALCEDIAPKIIIEMEQDKYKQLYDLLRATNLDFQESDLFAENIDPNFTKSEVILHFLHLKYSIETLSALKFQPTDDDYSMEMEESNVVKEQILSIYQRGHNLLSIISHLYNRCLNLRKSSMLPSSQLIEVACYYMSSYLLDVLGNMNKTLVEMKVVGNSLYSELLSVKDGNFMSVHLSQGTAPILDIYCNDLIIQECNLLCYEITKQTTSNIVNSIMGRS
jgi:hypothetical protein